MSKTVLDWLESTADRIPASTAVADPDDALTWSALRERARAAGTWVARHSAPRTAVALYLEKSPRALAAMLGAAYAGCFYSVIDVRQPEPRVRAIAETLAADVVVTDAANEEAARALLGEGPWEIALLDDVLACEADDALIAARQTQACDIDPLYVNFTSGSTGTPKGVVVSHRSVLDFVPVFARTFGIDETDVVANQAPFDFDVSVKDIYTCLLTGARLQIVPRAFFTAPTTLMDYLCETHATSLTWAVSALCFVSIMNGLAYRVPAEVRRVLFSGEVMPPKQLRTWQEALPDAQFANLYGPTEITCNCTYFVVDRPYANDEVIPMGTAFDNERVFLLADDGSEVTEAGEQGEVCVSGTALALGYLGRDEQTAAAFVQSPRNARWLEPIYRTGDLARYDEDGNLVYVSRKDHQIKHMGQRIELGDIEAAAQAIDGVEQACCLYDAKRKRLLLFYVGARGKDEVVDRLKETLPQYMVPGRVFPLDQMPLTKNGKVDRTALAALAKPARRARAARQ